MVRNGGAHFTCSVLRNGNSWVFLDDFNNFDLIFQSLDELYEQYPLGWFFGIYVKVGTNTVRPVSSSSEPLTPNFTITTRKRKSENKGILSAK